MKTNVFFSCLLRRMESDVLSGTNQLSFFKSQLFHPVYVNRWSRICKVLKDSSKAFKILKNGKKSLLSR